RLPGDRDWLELVKAVGIGFAGKSWRLLLHAVEEELCLPLIGSAIAAGGHVHVLAAPDFPRASMPPGTGIEFHEEREVRLQAMSDLADAFVVLPCGVTEIRDLHASWVLAGGGSSG